MTNEPNRDPIQLLREGKGATIRRVREEQGLSQAELAKLAKTSQQTVDRIERGVVEHSRAYPRILEALGMPNRGFDADRIQERLERIADNSRERHKANINENSTIESPLDSRIPVYSSGDGAGRRLVNAVPRSYPVEFVDGAYGLVMLGNEMEPAVRNGEIAIVNPNLPPSPQCEVVVRIDGRLTIRTLAGETDTHWSMQQWNPPAKTTMKKADHEQPQLVVARIGRFI